MAKFLVFACLATLGTSDLRMASQPKTEWTTQQRNRDVPFESKTALYMEPSAFNYKGLEEQRDGGGYDNFLRSNIDNEQDRRNFNTEDGKDHLPFRSYETAATDVESGTTVKHKMQVSFPAGDHIKVEVGKPFVVPLRWNNPHSSELEVNIWIMNKGNPPYVIPIRKPACSGEGYQDNVFTFKVPSNFNTVASCRKVGECVLQIYSHSVESRMYASGTPIIVEGGTGAWNTTGIKEAVQDTAFNLTMLRRLCLPSSSPEVDHTTAVIYKARLSSDVYNHAYQNSDFSPYAGQQANLISQNMQASCILKMTVGNFGELGKTYMAKEANEAREYAKKLDEKARNLIQVYETATNAVINAIQKEVSNNDTLPFVTPPAGATECLQWRDIYDQVPGGRVRGIDRNGGYCAKNLTCLCHQDCYLGYGKDDKEGDDAYCAVLEPDPVEVQQKDANGKLMFDSNGGKVMGPSGKMKIKPGSQVNRVARSAQKTETCFRCAEVGSISTYRENTNTYIPSFEIQGQANVDNALQYIAPIYLKSGFLTHPATGAITQKGDSAAILQIYMAVLTEMWDEFKSVSDGSYMQKHYKAKYDKLPEPKAESLKKYMFHYRGPVLKQTKATLSDANGGVDQKFKKLDATGKQDNGYYSAKKAWSLQAASTAVPARAGPISNQTVPLSTNMAGTATVAAVASGGFRVTFPPPEAITTSCSFVAKSAVTEPTISALGVDMDGLNADADCDDDLVIAAAEAAHDAACVAAQLANISYVCPPYPPTVCIIKGQGGKLPGQMFTNNQELTTGMTNSASAALPSAVVMIFASLPFFFF